MSRRRCRERGNAARSCGTPRSLSCALSSGPPKRSKALAGGAHLMSCGSMRLKRSSARQVITSAAGDGRFSNRSAMTCALPTAVARNASRRKIAFLREASTNVPCASGRTIRHGMSGNPAPEPTSVTLAFGGKWAAAVNDSSTWRVANSVGEHGATRWSRAFHVAKIS